MRSKRTIIGQRSCSKLDIGLEGGDVTATERPAIWFVGVGPRIWTSLNKPGDSSIQVIWANPKSCYWGSGRVCNRTFG
jgi:hypothetical protein